MTTLKLKKPLTQGSRPQRAPVRGVNGLRMRPSQADRAAQRSPQALNTQRPSPATQAPIIHKAQGRPTPLASATVATVPPQPRQAPTAPRNTAFAPRPRPSSLVSSQPQPTTAFEPIGRPNAFEPPPRRSLAQQRGPAPAPIEPDMRLSKRMSELGLASRREADEWIAKGWVRVDGKVVNLLGSRVKAGQLITVDTPAKFHQARKVTVLLNKPVNYVSAQAEDGHEPAWVLIRAENQWQEDRSGIHFRREHTRGLAPAGRLDLDSVGLLVMTQDGRVAKQLIGENSTIEKEYRVQVTPVKGGPPLSEAGLRSLNHGLSLDGFELKPARVDWIGQDQLRFVLQEGRKRQIRRMCEAVGLQVLSLERVRIGQVMLGALPPGRWRYLAPHESFGE